MVPISQYALVCLLSPGLSPNPRRSVSKCSFLDSLILKPGFPEAISVIINKTERSPLLYWHTQLLQAVQAHDRRIRLSLAHRPSFAFCPPRTTAAMNGFPGGSVIGDINVELEAFRKSDERRDLFVQVRVAFCFPARQNLNANLTHNV